MMLDPSDAGVELLASLIITTYNRCDALPATLQALARQTIPPERYEIIVVDDGSPDDTQGVLSRLALEVPLRIFRQTPNQGISAGRNLGITHARGQYLIFISDDLIVPDDFIELHVRTHAEYPGAWVVGGFEQLPEISATPFGRYLDALETSYDEGRKTAELAPGIWQLGNPTARNLSIPRSDLERIGLFDVQFRTSCEDVDLAYRARQAGIRFLYNERIRSLHNDQVGDLGRYCRAQIARTRDTVFYYLKHQEFYQTHGDPPIARAHSAIRFGDRPGLVAKKAAKRVLALPTATRLVELLAHAGERGRMPDPWLWRLYQLLVGIYMYRGWKLGMEILQQRDPGAWRPNR